MRSARALVWIVLAAAFLTDPAVAQDRVPPPPPDWSFALDGEPLFPRILSLDGDPDHPQPGDLAEIGPWLVPLGEKGSHRFRSGSGEAAGLTLEEGDRVPAPIGVVLDPEGKGLRILASLPDREARALRCLRIQAWSPAVAEQVARIDPAAACLVFEPSLEEPAPLPVLPEGLQRLAVVEREYHRLGNLDALAALRGLRFLRVRRYAMKEDFDAALLRGCTGLRHLEIDRQDLVHPEVLGTLADLRHLGIPGASVPGASVGEASLSVHFARRLGELRWLDVSKSEVHDLAVLSGHPSLRVLRAQETSLDAIPSRPMPALQEFHWLGGLGLPEGALEEFRAANPDCDVINSWRRILAAAVAGADRLRIRTGGTCHRNPAEERLLYEATDPEEVRSVLGALDFVDEGGGRRCMCCGGPTLEVLRGGTLLAGLAVHHGANLRWGDGGFPGDGCLTADARDALFGWMDRHGVKGPLAEWAEAKRAWRSMQQRWEIVRGMVPAGLWERLVKGFPKEETGSVFAEAVPDPAARAALALRIDGSGQGTWIKPDGPDYLARNLLEDPATAAAIPAALGNAPDDEVLDGAARRLFGDGRLDALPADPEVGARVLRAAALRALAHPRSYNRRKTLVALAALDRPEAREVLRGFLAAGVPVRELPAVLDVEGFQGFLPPEIGPVYEKCSDRALAALLLAEHGDRESLPAVRALEVAAPEEDREALRQAREQLEK